MNEISVITFCLDFLDNFAVLSSLLQSTSAYDNGMSELGIYQRTTRFDVIRATKHSVYIYSFQSFYLYRVISVELSE